MKSTLNLFIILLLGTVLLSGCVQQQGSNTGSPTTNYTGSTDSVDSLNSQTASDIEAYDYSEMENELNGIDESMSEIESAESVEEIDTTQ